MKTFILKAFFIAIVISQAGIMNAETPDNKPQQENKWMNEVRNFKHSFLIKETEMTEEQSKEFIPLYTEMENKIYQANRDARKMEQEISRSQQEISEDEYLLLPISLSGTAFQTLLEALEEICILPLLVISSLYFSFSLRVYAVRE